MTLCYLNGNYLPIEKAQISVLDRGFLFGDGVYEVIPFYNGNGFGLDEHLDRLEQSLAAVKIKSPLSHQEWKAIFLRLLSEQKNPDNSIYLQITRGVAEKRGHALPQDITPTVFAFATPIVRGSTHQGIAAITTEEIRWRYCGIKSINLLPNCLATQAAFDVHAQETIFIEDGNVTEGAISNIFIIRADKVYTSPADGRILNGVTRQLIINILQDLNIPLFEQAVSEEFLKQADEIWSTSSTREIAPIITLNQQPVANGKPGKVWQEVIKAYQQRIDRGG